MRALPLVVLCLGLAACTQPARDDLGAKAEQKACAGSDPKHASTMCGTQDAESPSTREAASVLMKMLHVIQIVP